jgi:ABC-type branched-subunit amino acid transport system substrate-binding protein
MKEPAKQGRKNPEDGSGAEMASSGRILLAGALALALFASGCGQKPGVADQITNAGAVLPPGATVNDQGEVVDSSGNVIGTTTGGDLTGGLSGGTTTGGTTTGSGTTGSGTTSGGTTTTTGGGTSGGTGGGGGGSNDDPAGAPSGGDATGVTNDTIVIGTHAPLTGAAPVPSDSAEKGKDIWFKWMADQGKSLFGRKVEVVLRNDNYNPSQAVAVCKEMVEQDHVFILSGSAGTDQIQACARYAASVGVPYLSAGVTEVGLTGLPGYFATSMTYPDQGPLLADFLINDLGAKDEKNGMLRFDTPNFQDAHDAFISAMDQKGAEVVYDRAVSKGADQTVAQTVVQEMKTAGIENVYVLTSPIFFIQVLQASKTQSYTPQWTGVGITQTFDTVATVGCRNGTLSGAKFFAPFTAWVDRNKYDPDFAKAMAKFYPEENGGDDFIWLGWSGTKAIWDMLALPGKELTRERFVYFLERARGLSNGIGPELNFTPEDHYGASQVHVNEAQCQGYKAGDSKWHTIQDFVSDF